MRNHNVIGRKQKLRHEIPTRFSLARDLVPNAMSFTFSKSSFSSLYYAEGNWVGHPKKISTLACSCGVISTVTFVCEPFVFS